MSVTRSLQKLCLRDEDLTHLPERWAKVKLEDVSELLPAGKLYDENTVLPEGEIPVLNQTAANFHGYHNDDPAINASPESPTFTFANHTCEMRLMTRPYSSIQNIFSRTGKVGISDVRFLYYATLGRVVLSAYKGHHPIFRSQWIPLPPLATQMTIVDTLSHYDTLIANNKRRIELLEHSARLLFKEWFVHLRYPGHEHDKIADGVPEGWARAKLGDCAKFLSGGTPSKARSEFWEGDIPWVSSGELTAMRIHNTSLRVTGEAIEDGSRMVPAETILAVVRGMSLAKEFRIGMTSRPMSFNQDLKAIVPRGDMDSRFLYQALDNQKDQIRDKATDASHGTKKLETPVLSEVPILVPARALRQQFSEQAELIHRQWDLLDQQNARLRSAQDLLLPRLMDGRLTV